MAMERSAVLLLCSCALASVAIVAWSGNQPTVLLVSKAQIGKEQTKLEAIENEMMGETPKSALAASQKAAKLQALIQTQKAMLAAAQPARVQQLSYEPNSFAQRVVPAWHKTNMLKAAEKPMALDITPQSQLSAQAQAAALARNLALAQKKQIAAAQAKPAVTKEARQLAQHLHAMHKQIQQNKPIVMHPKMSGKSKTAYHPHTNSVWDTTFPRKSEEARRHPAAVQPAPPAAGAAAKAPPGYVAVKALLPGQKLPKGAVELPASFMNKLASKGQFVPRAA